ncbi:MAG: site-specific DNA-methyltransferase [Pirellulaceae bacterium]|nr:site-specific DNA-methyltransferase [Pirellulaceae bacterium]
METDALYQEDCLKGLAKLPAECIDLAFADPPFNIGFEYDQYQDDLDDDQYLKWCQAWSTEIRRVLKPNGTFWLAIGDEYAAELKVMLTRKLNFHCRSWVIWYYTFGVNCQKKFNRSHAHLFHLVKDPKEFTFNTEKIRVPSARQLVYGDKRANPKGRLPDDTWVLRPQDIPASFSSEEDTWYFPRVAGTFKERRGFHGCQMPEQLLGRIIHSCSNQNDLVLDPFAGSGTTLAVAKKLNRKYLGYEISKDYCEQIASRLEETRVGDDLSGPANPLASVPSTRRGKRLKTEPS